MNNEEGYKKNIEYNNSMKKKMKIYQNIKVYTHFI